MKFPSEILLRAAIFAKKGQTHFSEMCTLIASYDIHILLSVYLIFPCSSIFETSFVVVAVQLVGGVQLGGVRKILTH